MSRVLTISDLQAPFQHRDAIDFLKHTKKVWRTERVVCLGDEVDSHGISDYDPEPDAWSAFTEWDRAIEFMHELYKVFPNVKAVTSNHTLRPWRVGKRSKLSLGHKGSRFMRSLREAMEAPKGWSWEEHHILDDIRYEHGDRLNGGVSSVARRAMFQRFTSVVFGHWHSIAGPVYMEVPGKGLLFGCPSGCLIDPQAYAFRYKSKRDEILGTTVVIDGVPYFEPMILNKRGRWVGPR